MPGYVEAMGWLNELRLRGQGAQSRHHQFRHAARLPKSSTPASRWSASSCNIPCSTSDRPTALRRWPRKNGVSFLCYGSVAGGFLSDKWLGVAEPATPLENRSLVKYKLIIDDFGGWDLFQHCFGR